MVGRVQRMEPSGQRYKGRAVLANTPVFVFSDLFGVPNKRPEGVRRHHGHRCATRTKEAFAR